MNVRILLEKPENKIVILITVISLISFLILNVIMGGIEQQLQSMYGLGVLDFEFAWNAEGINEIFDVWGQKGKTLEATAVWLDFLYIPSYGFLIAGCNLLVVRVLEGKFQSFGVFIVISPFIAGALDVIENINLLLMIYNDIFINLGSPFIASISATIKFALIGIAIIFFLIAVIKLSIQRIKKPNKREK